MPARLVANNPKGHHQPDFLTASLTRHNPVSHSNYTGYSHFERRAMGSEMLESEPLTLRKNNLRVPTFVPGGYIAVALGSQ